MLHSPRRLAALFALSTALCVGPAMAEMTKSLNLNGTTGLIDMPSGEAQNDATFSFSAAIAGPVTRGTLSFQITERLSASFRFQTWRDWNTIILADKDEFDDRSMDIRYLLLKEGDFWPAVTVGLIDFTGDGVFSSEYVAATKTFGDRLKVTAGLGWGRLGSYQSIGEPFGERPPLGDDGGKPNVSQWFRGDAAPFAGVEYKINDRWTFKGEYSSDAYTLEDDTRGIIERDSPFNFGLEYQRGKMARYGIYSLHGTEIALGFHLVLDPKTRATGGVMGAAPAPVKARPARASDPEAYDGGWVSQPDAGPILRENLVKRLAPDGIGVESLTYTAQTVEIRIRSGRLDAGAQAIGRTARALSHVMPASVEVFEIVPVVNGIGASKVTIRRSDLESLEFAADNASLLRERITLTDAGPMPANAFMAEDQYPRFRWSLRPVFSMPEPLKMELRARLSPTYDLAPGLVLSGQISKAVLSNIDRTGAASTSLLQPVRSDNGRYAKYGDPAMDQLTLAWYARPGEDLYSRVTIGYLERMHAGVSGELLWKPVNSDLALGVELNYTRQRDTDGGFGFEEYDYDVVTGHVSAYYDFGNGFIGQLDVGRYLAGDFGATVSVDRVFANGWKVGAFATLTDATAEEFGAGAFDKGIRFSIPVNWALGNQSQRSFGTTLRPSSGDGGARVNVDGRIYDSIREYHSGALDADWGRVWR